MLLVYSTFPSEKEARKAAKRIVGEGLAACATFWKAGSVYRWKGKLREEAEWVLELKCRDVNYPKVAEALEKTHPYELPAIYAVPVAYSTREYLKWVGERVF